LSTVSHRSPYLVEIHSENKAGTAATYKSGFGFHPLLCFADATGETLAALLRPGDAGASTGADHLCVLDAVLRRARGGMAAAGADPSAIGSVIVPLGEKFGDSSTRADRAQRRP
jgi:Transposase DDE domain group 1